MAILLTLMSASARADVTIRSVRLIDYKIDRTKPFVTSKGQSDSCYGIFVLLSADDGAGHAFTALGDVLPRGLVTNESMADAWAGATAMGDAISGQTLAGKDVAADVATIRQWLARLDAIAAGQKLTTRTPPPADKQLRATLCGFDEALLDLAGQVHGVPVYVLLGGAKQSTVTVSALTSNADVTADDITEKADDEGGKFAALRLKIGLGDDDDVQKIAAAAAELVQHGRPTKIWVDVNHAWGTGAKSIAMLGKIRDALAAAKFTSTFICEQPTAETDLPALAAVTKQTRAWGASDPFKIVTMADEAMWTLADAKAVVAADACDLVNIKIQKAGGLLASKDIADYLAVASPSMGIYVGGVVSTDVTSWANLQLCFALPRLDYATACVPRRTYKTNVASVPINYDKTLSQGKTFSRPTEPGLGTALDLTKLEPFIRHDHAAPTTRPVN